jgi:hypothetical protein
MLEVFKGKFEYFRGRTIIGGFEGAAVFMPATTLAINSQAKNLIGDVWIKGNQHCGLVNIWRLNSEDLYLEANPPVWYE